ncbi:MAG: T9SS type A sorting domain-containing protein [Flavobacterium sp.]|uniref:S8 family serine peptidase n=1 Tax=Flavobacterium sp. TaxID=239 RepID=UPI001209A6DB|nr:S8 family serine peptidase [Flavobacterium sp.]RZJ67419.1 MAG: T9SS type A sorting domain-containing protein [Flavobacterium sp.]
MKKLLVLIAFVFSSVAFAQQDAWVYFNAKPNSQFYFDNPLEMLSQRALDRRAAQNIAVDLVDVPIHQPFVDQVEAASGITVLATSKWLNAIHVRGSVIAINALANLTFVSSVDFADDSLDSRSAKSGAPKYVPTANHTQKVLDTQVDFAYGGSANQIQMLNGHLLHQQDFTGSGKIIAVLDAGFPNVNTAAPFQRLLDNNLILGGYNFVDRDDNIYSRNNHGTLVLSTMGGYVENQLVGTAPDAQYYLFITEAIEYENPLEESLWVEAAERADSLGVDVINSSLGYPSYDNPAYDYSYEERDGMKAFITRGADIAFTRGMVVVVSAGNEGSSDDPFVSVPADGFNVLSIGAVTSTEAYATFSSIGPTTDGRVKPDVVAKGQGATVANTQGNVATSNGTSFSSPIMAGMIATFWSAVPNLTNQQVVNFVKQSADLFANPTALKGYGVPDFALALQNALLSTPSSAKKEFTIYPNPVADIITINFPETATSATMTIFDASGKTVLTKHVDRQRNSVDCSNINPGVYFYSIVSDGAKQTGKLIKS